MLEVIILALALSMDAFAVSIGLGSKHVINAKPLSLSAAIYFGVFQGIMPLIGFLEIPLFLSILSMVEIYIPQY